MSYILEALADSEQARLQIAAAPRYSLLPAVGEEMPRTRVWPYALAGALLVNAAVLQLWLRPAAPESVASIKAPTAPQRTETAVAAAAPRLVPPDRGEPPTADSGEFAPRDARLPAPPPARAYELLAAPAPASAIQRPPSATTANARAPAQVKNFAPKVAAKRKAEDAAASVAAPTVLAKAASASAGASLAPAPAVPKAALPGTGMAVIAAPAPAAAVSAAGTELPSALLQELPALAVAGFIRDEGSSSLVIVNDKLAREGDEVAPGVKLEKIVGDSLVFNYKGYRFKR
jgi:general secretion pathway protein B